jgi:hypothetical protein
LGWGDVDVMRKMIDVVLCRNQSTSQFAIAIWILQICEGLIEYYSIFYGRAGTKWISKSEIIKKPEISEIQNPKNESQSPDTQYASEAEIINRKHLNLLSSLLLFYHI